MVGTASSSGCLSDLTEICQHFLDKLSWQLPVQTLGDTRAVFHWRVVPHSLTCIPLNRNGDVMLAGKTPTCVLIMRSQKNHHDPSSLQGLGKTAHGSQVLASALWASGRQSNWNSGQSLSYGTDPSPSQPAPQQSSALCFSCGITSILTLLFILTTWGSFLHLSAIYLTLKLAV